MNAYEKELHRNIIAFTLHLQQTRSCLETTLHKKNVNNTRKNVCSQQSVKKSILAYETNVRHLDGMGSYFGNKPIYMATKFNV